MLQITKQPDKKEGRVHPFFLPLLQEPHRPVHLLSPPPACHHPTKCCCVVKEEMEMRLHSNNPKY